jgi:hypothetical protein
MAANYHTPSGIDISTGATVRIRTWDGKVVRAKVEDRGEKDGRTLVDLDNNHWAYLYQVEGGSRAKAGSIECSEYEERDEWNDCDDDWN